MSEEKLDREGNPLKPRDPNAEPPIWKVCKHVPLTQLQSCLNKLADAGYQVKDLLRTTAPYDHKYLQEGAECFHVVAFDGARIMKKQQEDMQRHLAAMSEALGAAPSFSPQGVPGAPIR